MKRHTVYVDHTVTTTARSCLVVTDEADLQRQLIALEAAFRASAFITKPQKDKSGKIVFHELNKDWDLPDEV